MKRGGELKRRAPLRAVGRRGRAANAALARARRVIKARSAGACEVRRVVYDRGRSAPVTVWAALPSASEICGRSGGHAGEHAHHVEPNDRDRNVHDPERLLWVCSTAHGWIHSHPARASELGLLRPEGTATP